MQPKLTGIIERKKKKKPKQKIQLELIEIIETHKKLVLSYYKNLND